ncbi:hypothetical protein DENSPDRAFT_845247, partial [Dentipellis sp. KUC8613]
KIGRARQVRARRLSSHRPSDSEMAGLGKVRESAKSVPKPKASKRNRSYVILPYALHLDFILGLAAILYYDLELRENHRD